MVPVYDLGGPLSDTHVPPGTNVLVVGPPLTGKRRLASQILARGLEANHGALFVTTADPATKLRDRYGTLFAREGRVATVDCVSRHQGVGGGDESVTYVSAPDDMTGIGIGVSDHLKQFQDTEGSRTALSTLSALLLYSNLQTVFRFLHVFTSRIGTTGGLGVYLLEAGIHDEETTSTLNQLFDGVVRTRPSDPPDIEALPPGAESD